MRKVRTQKIDGIWHAYLEGLLDVNEMAPTEEEAIAKAEKIREQILNEPQLKKVDRKE